MKTNNTISIERLEQYLSNSGWTKNPLFKKENIVQYITPDQTDGVAFPVVNTFCDYKSAINFALKTIAEIQNIDINLLIKNISHSMEDVIKWRINNAYTKNGTIPLENALSVMSNIKQIISISTKDILNPSSYHSKVMTPEVSKHIEKYRLGQSEIGSYIFNLVCPFSSSSFPFDEQEHLVIPFERKVNEQLYTTIQDISKCIETNNKTIIDENVDKGIYSSNLLQSLIELDENSRHSGLNLTFDWNPNVKSRFTEQQNIRIEPSFTEILTPIAEKYKPTNLQTEQTFYGKIKTISADPEPSQRENIAIQLSAIDVDSNKITIKAILPYSEHDSIQEAFTNGKTIKLRGEYKYGRSTNMTHPILQVLEE